MRAFNLIPLLLLCACGVDGEATVRDEGGEESDIGQAQLASDGADRACNVVLREMARPAGATGGYQVKCNTGGVCNWVWRANVDLALSAKAAGSTVWVQYKRSGSATWLRKQAAMTPGAPKGYQRYSVVIEPNLAGPSMSATSLQNSRLDVLPYLRKADGSRLFDHNRVTGDFDVYTLDVKNHWSVAHDPNACRAEGSSRSVLSFNGDFTQTQRGPLLVGGKGVIEYALERLPACRSSRYGYPAWDTTARVRFQPMGTVIERSVRGYDSLPNSGTPDLSKPPRSLPFEFDIPLGTQRLEVWFENNGLWCSPAFDSNFGNNHVFAVDPDAPKAIGWVGGVGASTSRDCEARPGIAEPIILDGYVRERACSFVDAQVWAQGLTDAPELRTERLVARAELELDGVKLPSQWLRWNGRAGNDWSFRFELPRDVLYYGSKWSTLKYTLQFSTDGVSFKSDVPRTVKRDASWCNPAWGSCN